MSFELRPYQVRMRRDLYKAIREGRRVVGAFSATGTGKTEFAGAVIADLLSRGGRSLFIVDRLELCEQTAERFSMRYGFPSSVCQGSHPLFRPAAPIQVGTWQTLTRRREWLLGWLNSDEASTLIWWDEAHETGWTSFADWFLEETKARPKTTHVMLTATPERMKPTEGMGDICDAMVVGLTTREAMECDPPFLVWDRYVDVPLEGVDLDAVKIDAKTGDYDEDELGEIMSAGPTVRTAVRSYIGNAGDRIGIVYAVTVRHATALMEEFRVQGIHAAVISGETPKAERKEALESLVSGRLQVLCNCAIAIKGIDIPEVSAIMISRPTKSIALWIQADGRGLRLDPLNGKVDCIILDQGGCVARLGRARDYGPYELLKGLKPGQKGMGAENEPPEPWVCRHCSTKNPVQLNACKGCGERKPPRAGARDYSLEYPDGSFLSPVGSKLWKVPAKIAYLSEHATKRWALFTIRHPADKRWYTATGTLGSSQIPVAKGEWVRLTGRVTGQEPAGTHSASVSLGGVSIEPDMTYTAEVINGR